jgi:hypothetical protein
VGIKIKRKIIIGCVLSTFILILLPAIPSIECNTVKESNEIYHINFFNNVVEVTDKIREKIQFKIFNNDNGKLMTSEIDAFFYYLLKSDFYNIEFLEKVSFIFEVLKNNLFGGFGLMGFALLLFFMFFMITIFIPLFVLIFGNIDEFLMWIGYLILLIFIIIFFVPTLILYILAQIIIIIFDDIFNEPLKSFYNYLV